MTQLGKATGPQRAPRKQAGARAPAAEPEVQRAGAQRTDEERRGSQYNALVARILTEVEQMGERVSNMPQAGELRGPPADEVLYTLADIEKRATLLRVDLDQLGCGL